MQQSVPERKDWLKEELIKPYKAAHFGKAEKSEVVEFDEIAVLVNEIYDKCYAPRSLTALIVNRPVQ